MKILFNTLCFVGVLGLFMLQSCETTDLDLTKNPNQLSPDQASPDFLLNGIQEDFARVVEAFGRTGAEVTRIDYMFGRSYINNYQPNTFDGRWEDAYTEIRTDLGAMYGIANERGLNYHIGMGKFMEAYTMVTLVDFFGDVPYSEANLGAENFNPNLDDGASVYAAAFDLLDEAQAAFGAPAAALPQNDFFYDGDEDLWIKAINSLRMKMYMTTRLVDNGALAAFNQIVASGNYITSIEEDLQFSWGTNVVQPDTRHPRYGLNYAPSGGASDYMSIDLMNYMDTNDDPRLRYYFYRQNEVTPGSDGSDPALETLQCSLQEAPAHYDGFPFCTLPNGFWGRDHGNNEGIPPDGFLRTTVGVYPAGGKFDDDSFEGMLLGDGAGGNGITPIILSSSMDFLIAEAAMVAGNVGAAKAAVLEGLTKSVEKVLSFGERDGSSDLSLAPTQAEVDAHADLVDAAFDADTEGGWNVLAREFFTSLYGNGIDAYNFYRRTGYPTNLQPNVEPQPGGFIRSFFYPANFVNNNSNVTQKSGVTSQVYWDTNPSSPGFPESN
ncbi:SusD/RagB family nutrient-binding outer membrane lipoprotein [Robiginitalea sp. SC105]|uniref:SusD/RagB family nutrient-binding outer membrane lipoprotein n=1 Tax=Robiginitalea sp. SC105 TaxID=2762332 RepID=UPI00163A96B6|nr:SusD/RagB family nutrient-binding outer membrane lipoprotein [Robiginitalea sp. SC105]MBC2839613.1 SusD/RagB family nutrient-binding outer membrane lipoprotein [Robiginitalea sp. SC105]